MERTSLRDGLVQRVLAALRSARGRLDPTRPPAQSRDISAAAIDEDEAYLARHPGVRHERRVLACMRSLASGSPMDLLEATYGRDIVGESLDRLRAQPPAVDVRTSVADS